VHFVAGGLERLIGQLELSDRFCQSCIQEAKILHICSRFLKKRISST
jgi:hypothetical protein